jgi:uncharacterized tellurite resistance protein B-like protein
MKDVAKSRLLDLYRIALADGKIQKNEYHLIIDIARKIGLTDDDTLDILNGVIDFDITIPNSINDRMQHLFHMLFLMKVDGDINSKEVQTIKNIVITLGLNLSMTDELIKLMSKYKTQLVPESEMIKLVKTYMN